MKSVISVALGILLVGFFIAIGSTQKTKADDKGYQEFDTTYVHCILVKTGGYNGNNPALACVPNGRGK